MKNIYIFCSYLVILALCFSCQKDDDKFYDQPIITKVSKPELYLDEMLTISGQGFLPMGNIVTLDESNVILPIIEESTTEIKVIFPSNVKEDRYTLTVTSGKKIGSYNAKIAVYIPSEKTIITAINRPIAMIGDTITISGNNFRLKNNVAFLSEGSVPLTVISENKSEIQAIIPEHINGGKYTVGIYYGASQTTTYDPKIEIVDPNVPKIISLEKDYVMKGVDDLIIYGENFISNATLYIQKNGSNNMVLTNCIPDNNNKITIPADTLSTLAYGKYSFYIKIGERESDKHEFTLICDPYKPSIVDLKTKDFCTGTYFILDATNFNESDVVIQVYSKAGAKTTLPILSKSADENIIIVSAEGLAAGEYSAVEILSNGKSDKKDVSFRVNNCGTPNFTSLDKENGQPNDYIIINVDNASSMISSNINYISIEIGGVVITGDVNKHSNFIRFKVPEDAEPGVTDIKVYRYFDIAPSASKKLYFTIPSFTILETLKGE